MPADAVYTAHEIEKLVAPIALYPDALLAQALPASAYPVDIVQGARWLDKNKAAVAKQDFSGVDALALDPSVKALVRFPEVVKKMNDDLDWTTDLGDAFVNQPQDVADAIQRLRAKADVTGSLRTNEQQKVVKREDAGQKVIIIESASPEVIYVPTYDPVAGLQSDGRNGRCEPADVRNSGRNRFVREQQLLELGRWNRLSARWPGYPNYRPGGGNNINIGNNVNIGERYQHRQQRAPVASRR